MFAPIREGDILELRFSSNSPVAIKVGVDKQNALNGKPWTDELQEPQDYIPCPSQTSLKGFQESTGRVRRFQAATLKQVLQDQGGNRYGGIQLLVIPQVSERVIPDVLFDTFTPEADLARKTLRPGPRFPQLMKKDKAGARYNHTQRLRCFIHLMDWNWWAGEIGFL